MNILLNPTITTAVLVGLQILIAAANAGQGSWFKAGYWVLGASINAVVGWGLK